MPTEPSPLLPLREDGLCEPVHGADPTWHGSDAAAAWDPRLPRLREAEVGATANSGGPARRHRLEPRVEADPLRPVHMVVPEQGALPATEAVVRRRHRDRDIHADHAGLDPGREVAGGLAVPGEDRGAVAVLVLVDQRDGLLVILRPHHAQHRAEDLLAVDAHAGVDAVEQTPAEEKAVLVACDPAAAAVHHQLRPLLDAEVDIAAHL